VTGVTNCGDEAVTGVTNCGDEAVTGVTNCGDEAVTGVTNCGDEAVTTGFDIAGKIILSFSISQSSQLIYYISFFLLINEDLLWKYSGGE
jgi:hypothetical protein